MFSRIIVTLISLLSMSFLGQNAKAEELDSSGRAKLSVGDRILVKDSASEYYYPGRVVNLLEEPRSVEVAIDNSEGWEPDTVCGNCYRDMVLKIMQEIDGFKKYDSVIVRLPNGRPLVGTIDYVTDGDVLRIRLSHTSVFVDRRYIHRSQPKPKLSTIGRRR